MTGIFIQLYADVYHLNNTWYDNLGELYFTETELND